MKALAVGILMLMSVVVLTACCYELFLWYKDGSR